MKIIVENLIAKIPQWNKQYLSETFFYEFCEVNDILVIEIPLRYNVKAMLWFVDNEFVLTVNSALYGIERLFGMWHEIGHYILHSPNKTVGSYFWGDEKIYSHRNRREEDEADAFALCCLIPRSWLDTKTFNELLEEGFTERQLWKRKAIFEKSEQ